MAWIVGLVLIGLGLFAIRHFQTTKNTEIAHWKSQRERTRSSRPVSEKKIKAARARLDDLTEKLSGAQLLIAGLPDSYMAAAKKIEIDAMNRWTLVSDILSDPQCSGNDYLRATRLLNQLVTDVKYLQNTGTFNALNSPGSVSMTKKSAG